MKCESNYISQLKQNIADPSKENEDSVEDALIKAANSLIVAKFQLDQIDNQGQPIADKGNGAEGSRQIEATKSDDKGGRRAIHKTSTSMTAESKKNGPQVQQSKSEHKS